MENACVPMDGLDVTKEGNSQANGLPLARERRVAHLFEPVYTGGHPIHALGDLGTREG